jgi:RNA polymerase sigma factor (sigma-70 family)
VNEAVQLCARIRSGEDLAVEQLQHALRKRLLHYLTAKCGNDAEDLLQDVTLRTVLCIQSDSIEHPERIYVWAWSVAKHLAADYHRRHKRVVSIDEARSVHSEESDALDSFIRRERFSLVLRALQKLDPLGIDLVRRFYFERQRDEQVALELGRSQAAIKSLRWRAIQFLKDELNDGGSVAWAA